MMLFYPRSEDYSDDYETYEADNRFCRLSFSWSSSMLLIDYETEVSDIVIKVLMVNIGVNLTFYFILKTFADLSKVILNICYICCLWLGSQQINH